jgi:predicted NBD/HSP70 family sugar kinase
MIGAVDIGGTKIAAGIVDANGRVLARAEVHQRGSRLSLRDRRRDSDAA